jgi:hypothetical protein
MQGNRLAERAVVGSYLRFLWMPTIEMIYFRYGCAYASPQLNAAADAKAKGKWERKP